MINKKHIGQEFKDFLQEEGIYEQVQLNALKKTLAHPDQSPDGGTRHTQDRDGRPYENEPILPGPSPE